MKILLLQEVRKLGKAGDIVDVSTGYARNFLIPKKLGVEATKGVMVDYENKKAAEAARRKKEEEEAISQAGTLSGKKIVVKAKAGENDKLFGTITAQMVADALKEQVGYEVDKKKIILPDEIKTLGDYKMTVRLMANAVAEMTLKVENDA